MTTKILILTASGGSSHNLTAQAIQKIINKLEHETVETRIEDIFANSSAFTNDIIRFYNFIHRHAPWFHHIYFNIFEFSALMQWGTKTFVSDYYKNLIHDYQPNLILSVFGSLNRGYFEVAKDILGEQVFCVTFSTEYTGGYGFSVNWVNPKADLFWCYTEEVKQQAIQLGMTANKIQLSNYLLRENFSLPTMTKDEKQIFLTQELKLELHKFTLLLSTNGAGSQNHLDLVQSLLPLSDKLQVIAVCGNNLKAKDKLINWCLKHSQLKVCILGFTDKMHQLLQVSQANVQRAGFMITAESVHLGCPIIFNGIGGIMPQESLAIRHFVPRQMAVVMTRPRQLFKIIKNWLDNPIEYENIRQNMANYEFHPTSPQAIISRLIEQTKN